MVELNPPKGYDEQSRSHLKNIIGLVSTVVSNSFVLCTFFLMNKARVMSVVTAHLQSIPQKRSVKNGSREIEDKPTTPYARAASLFHYC